MLSGLTPCMRRKQPPYSDITQGNMSRTYIKSRDSLLTTHTLQKFLGSKASSNHICGLLNFTRYWRNSQQSPYEWKNDPLSHRPSLIMRISVAYLVTVIDGGHRHFVTNKGYMCTRASFPSVFKNVFHLFYHFDALFTRTKGKYFQRIELAPTSAINCWYLHPSLRENTNENARKRYCVHRVKATK